ncbi:MAG TPA: glycoside hydrolase family 88 protein [Bacteroidota bacterium]
MRISHTVAASLIIGCMTGFACISAAQKQPWSVRIADSFLARHPGAVTYDSASPEQRWNYEQGLMLVALERLWRQTDDRRYLDFVRSNIDHYVRADGTIDTYRRTDYNLDNIAPGRVLLALYTQTGEEKYRRAADTLRQQLREQPRTLDGGFWHKQIYPWQMWLDGLFMAEPFYATYGVVFHDLAALEDAMRQFRLVTHHTRDPRTGLLYHGWDESRKQRWADTLTGRSPSFWARAIGWYTMALVEVLDILPDDYEGRDELVGMLRDAAEAVAAVQDSASGLWYQVIDQAGRPGNYLEASASAMFTYSFARGVKAGYLDPSFAAHARKAFQGITGRLVRTDPHGFISLEHTCKSAGLGGNPYRDGSYQYYISEPQRTNDLKGLGSFLLAAIAIEQLGGR